MTQESKPCVVGLGKLGLPLAGVLASAGFRVTGLDLNQGLVKEIENGMFKSPEPELNILLTQFQKNLNFTSRFEDTSECNIFFLIVPTPSKPDGSFDNSSLIGAISQLLCSWEKSSGEKTIVIVSTVMPGTCQSVFIPMIREWERDNQNQVRVSLLYSPEFIALGTVVHNLRNPDMTLIGTEDPNDAQEFLSIMNSITGGKPKNQILNLTEAEIVKLLVNCFVTMKISFANFIGELTGFFPDTDKYKVAQALGMDTRIGGKYLRPGYGFAGPCFPRDNKALIALSSSFGLNPSLGLATDEINMRQPEQVFKQLIRSYPKAKKIGVIGLTYKPHTRVVEESQTLKLSEIIEAHELQVVLFDPLIAGDELQGRRIASDLSELSDCDVLVVSKEFEFVLTSQKLSEVDTFIV